MDHRRWVALAAATPVLFAVPALGQDDERDLRGMLRTCSAISDVAARVACYDAIPVDGPAATSQPSGLGAEQVPEPRVPRAVPTDSVEAPDSIVARVAAAVQRQPGIHLLTLEDGAQWQFVEGVPGTYEPPRRGSTVEIRSGALGGYLLRYQGQQAVRVRRVR